jgi:hypothetical protein
MKLEPLPQPIPNTVSYPSPSPTPSHNHIAPPAQAVPSQPEVPPKVEEEEREEEEGLSYTDRSSVRIDNTSRASTPPPSATRSQANQRSHRASSRDGHHRRSSRHRRSTTPKPRPRPSRASSVRHGKDRREESPSTPTRGRSTHRANSTTRVSLDLPVSSSASVTTVQHDSIISSILPPPPPPPPDPAAPRGDARAHRRRHRRVDPQIPPLNGTETVIPGDTRNIGVVTARIRRIGEMLKTVLRRLREFFVPHTKVCFSSFMPPAGK